MPGLTINLNNFLKKKRVLTYKHPTVPYFSKNIFRDIKIKLDSRKFLYFAKRLSQRTSFSYRVSHVFYYILYDVISFEDTPAWAKSLYFKILQSEIKNVRRSPISTKCVEIFDPEDLAKSDTIELLCGDRPTKAFLRKYFKVLQTIEKGIDLFKFVADPILKTEFLKKVPANLAAGSITDKYDEVRQTAKALIFGEKVKTDYDKDLKTNLQKILNGLFPGQKRPKPCLAGIEFKTSYKIGKHPIKRIRFRKAPYSSYSSQDLSRFYINLQILKESSNMFRQSHTTLNTKYIPNPSGYGGRRAPITSFPPEIKTEESWGSISCSFERKHWPIFIQWVKDNFKDAITNEFF